MNGGAVLSGENIICNVRLVRLGYDAFLLGTFYNHLNVEDV